MIHLTEDKRSYILMDYECALDHSGIKNKKAKIKQFTMRIDYLLTYYKAVNQSGEEMTLDQKKTMLSMYNGLLQEMNLINKKYDDITARSLTSKLNEDFTDFQESDPQKIKEKLNSIDNTDPKDLKENMHPKKVSKEVKTLYTLYCALLKSSQKIHGRPSKEYNVMLTDLYHAFLFARDVRDAYADTVHSSTWWEDTINTHTDLYVQHMKKLKNSAAKYYMTKIRKTSGGMNANERERTRLELANLLMDTANGMDRTSVENSIPRELKSVNEEKHNQEPAVLLCC